MKCCVSTDVGTRTWTNWLTFELDPDYSPDAATELLSPVSYKLSYAEFYVGKSHVYVLTRPDCCSDAWIFGMVLFSRPSKQLCQRYMRSTECPSSILYYTIDKWCIFNTSIHLLHHNSWGLVPFNSWTCFSFK